MKNEDTVEFLRDELAECQDDVVALEKKLDDVETERDNLEADLNAYEYTASDHELILDFVKQYIEHLDTGKPISIHQLDLRDAMRKEGFLVGLTQAVQAVT